MPKMRSTWLVAVVAVILLVAALSRSAPRERFLVLGFSAKQLNDVQDRLLREALMRHLVLKGFRIVPVMDVESVLQGDRRERVRSLTRDEVRGLSRDLEAGYACYGWIESEEGRQDDAFAEGKRYRCSLVMYRRDRDAFEEHSVSFAGRDSFYVLFEELSRALASRIESAL
jgi:hypothetical protein